MKYLLLFISFCTWSTLICVQGYAQSDTVNADMDLNSLKQLRAETQESALQKYLNIKVSASSKKGLTTRETPGIVTVITADEIRQSSASDLLEILEMVPGFDFGQDVDFMVGIGLRGNWSNEGKVLLLIDGIEYNDLLYQTIPFGNHFPVDQIDRIEIIRGPGSAIYGGTAEYGVINVITKGGNGLHGIQAYGEYGTVGRLNAGIQAGGQFSEDIYGDLSVHYGEHVLSDQQYQDLYEESDPVNLKNLSGTQAASINAGLTIKGLQFRAIYDDYSFNSPDYLIEFSNIAMDLKYILKLSDRLKLIPRVSFTSQQPWKVTESETNETDYEVTATRTRASLTGFYSISRKLSLEGGLEGFYDVASSNLDDENFGPGIDQVSYNNVSAFAEGLMNHPLVNITLGFRYDYHNIYGAAFVPRIGLTKRLDNFHFKMLYSHSYRAPGIENINANTDISPEKTKTIECELGQQFNPDMILSLNAYYIYTKDIILYEYIDLGEDGYEETYFNSDKAGSKGLELIYRYYKNRFRLNTSYSLYAALDGNTVETSQVPQAPNVYLGFPSSKLAFQFNYKFSQNLWTDLGVIYKSKRYAYDHIDQLGSPEIGIIDPYLVANFSLGYDELFCKGLSIKASGIDLFNARPQIIQPYNGDYSPVPGRSREFRLKLTYNLSFLSNKAE